MGKRKDERTNMSLDAKLNEYESLIEEKQNNLGT